MGKIVLEVSDGIVQVLDNPDEIEIEIHDYDWPREDLKEGQDYQLIRGTFELEYPQDHVEPEPVPPANDLASG